MELILLIISPQHAFKIPFIALRYIFCELVWWIFLTWHSFRSNKYFFLCSIKRCSGFARESSSEVKVGVTEAETETEERECGQTAWEHFLPPTTIHNINIFVGSDTAAQQSNFFSWPFYKTQNSLVLIFTNVFHFTFCIYNQQIFMCTLSNRYLDNVNKVKLEVNNYGVMIRRFVQYK